ncbi:hypothetical protein NP233_g10553 [Leucocoprinus birnbaumii]|uniref:pyranose dehydrogenase (acceptor) n=1 Tax=Leucocoprinus birnbaumii TaxID=56174 RepID=A0AAD5VIG6_9AGAR|nr:hypothetical protein NP233_g10553 [Leucocoprinus birnbaumii]
MPLIELKEFASRSYDYVIVGGGTAGLALAARLTEDMAISVLVLEAGVETLNDPRISHFGQTFGQKEYDWCATTIPQVNANSTVFSWPRGRMIGGSSGVNFFAWNKPAREDIDAWEQLGNEGWNWERVNKYIQKAITFTPPTFSEAEHVRRETPNFIKESWAKGPIGNGPIQISYPPLRIDLDIQSQKAFQEMGLSFATAPLDGNPNGIVIGPATIDPMTLQRSFAGNAYWKPNSERSNLSLLTNAVVHRFASTEVEGELLITGVEFSHKDSIGGEILTVKALKEILLCAGTLMTPKILELSGIGRPIILQEAGIPVNLALEGVGENVQDHIQASVVIELKDDVLDETYDVLRNPREAEKHRALFAQGQGLHTMGVQSFIYTPLSSLTGNAQDIIAGGLENLQLGMASGKYSEALMEQYNIAFTKLEKVPSCEIVAFPGWTRGKNMPVAGKKYYTLVAALNGLFSRGTIHVKTSDPTVPGAIDPHYFEEDIDLKMLREMVKFCRRMARAEAFKPYFGETPQELSPGPDIVTDEELEEYLRSYCGTIFHPIGSASMLPREKGGVVDTKLKVYGTKNLRVVDLSIVPLHVGSHPQSLAYGIGEIAADIIKGLV